MLADVDIAVAMTIVESFVRAALSIALALIAGRDRVARRQQC